MTVNANQTLMEIHLLCVLLHPESIAPTPIIVSVTLKNLVPLDSHAKKENVVISVIALSVDHGLHVIQENVYVHLVTLEIQRI